MKKGKKKYNPPEIEFTPIEEDTLRASTWKGRTEDVEEVDLGGGSIFDIPTGSTETLDDGGIISGDPFGSTETLVDGESIF